MKNKIYNKEDVSKTGLDDIVDKYGISEELINFTVYVGGESPKNYKNYYYYSTIVTEGGVLGLGFVKNSEKFKRTSIDYHGDKLIEIPKGKNNYFEWEYANPVACN
jgi:hypothetical protein